jgi:hypothetical protein
MGSPKHKYLYDFISSALKFYLVLCVLLGCFRLFIFVIVIFKRAFFTGMMFPELVSSAEFTVLC